MTTGKGDATKQISLDASRIHIEDLTPTQIKHLLSKIKKQGGCVLKAEITPSAVDLKKGGANTV